MDVHLNERDQVEQLKKWWNQYGLIGILTIVLGVGGNYAWTYYQSRQVEHAQNASIVYEQMKGSLAKNDINEFKTRANYILENYKKTPYAALASFTLSSEALKENKLEDAKYYLKFVLDNHNKTHLRQIARIRMARILLAQQAYNDALSTLAKVDDKTFMPMIEEVRGDVYLAQGDSKKANLAYKSALETLSTGDNPVLRMKYEESA